MGKYRKLPVVIEAMQFTDDNKNQVFNWITCNRYPYFDENKNPILKIETLEGDMIANFGDWIIKGVAGGFYPCKDDIFRKTYEEVEDDDFNSYKIFPAIPKNVKTIPIKVRHMGKGKSNFNFEEEYDL